jgi:hypothetical protein
MNAFLLRSQSRGAVRQQKFVWVALVFLPLIFTPPIRGQFVLQPGAVGQIQMYVENMGPPVAGGPLFDYAFPADPPLGTGKMITPGSGYKAYNPDTITPAGMGTALNTFIGGVSGPLPVSPFVQFLTLATPGVFAYGDFKQTVDNNGVHFFSNGLIDRFGTAVNTGGVFGPDGAASEIFGGSTALWQYTGPAGFVNVGVGLAVAGGFLVNPAGGDQAAAGVIGVFTRYNALGALLSQVDAAALIAAGNGVVGGLVDGFEDHASGGPFAFGGGVFTATGPNTFNGWSVGGYAQFLNPGDFLKLDMGVTLVADPDASFSLADLPVEAPDFFGSGTDMTLIPEPSTVALMLVGIMLLGAGRLKLLSRSWPRV